MQKMFGRLIGANIELVTTLSSQLGTVHADNGQLEQVLMNLVVNAKDAMPLGGRLMIETAEVEIDKAGLNGEEPSVGRFARLSVRDSGTGMDAATRDRLFEPFFTTKEPGKGTGLGLATVYGIVQQSGGFMRVESSPGMGATFSVYLPRADDFHYATEFAQVS